MKYNIIDANSIGYAAQGSPKLTSGGMQTQAAFGFLRTMREMRIRFPEHVPLVLWDGKADWRFKLHPLYKSNRDTDPKKVAERDAYALQRPYIQRALSALAVKQVTVSTHEADDMAGYFVRTLAADPKNEILLSTGDGDWLQLVRKNVSWRDNRDDAKFITADNFYEKTGCLTPFAFLECKILQGDTSDVISGVGGIGEKGAPEFIAEFGSVREFWRRCDAGEFAPKYKAHKSLWQGKSPITLEEHMGLFPANDGTVDEKTYVKSLKKHQDAYIGQGRSIYKRNFQLMQLLKVNPPKKTDTKVDIGAFDKESFANICEELSFLSILRSVDEFTNLFKK
jgi:DNA polymerase-1